MQPTGLRTTSRIPGEKPFLKWAGGKSRYASALVGLAPEFTGSYREPFLGSGAVFFELGPRRAVLSDANEELVVCFRVVAGDPESVMARLDEMPNTPEHFEHVRRQRPRDLSDLERAARVVYLNKTSFRGLWRVNRRNEFNTPYGAYDRPYYNRTTFLRAARALSGAVVRVADFEQAIDDAETGDWVYCDPPYVPLGGWSDFRRYTAGQFGADDQVRLYKAMRRAADRGVFITMTNSDTPFVRDLFGGDFRVLRLATRRDISLNASARRSWDVVVTSYDPPVPSQAPFDRQVR
ncbi:Dam family site-specific DNA-(adenine-N6)-methyltransferase [Frankia sp. CiP1_Cm_nod1]|uniref:Dam family site-specific DNA-(adenine-N6)-methyltransferase n=2 Tax=unclassified Frankia TaxID=2632575 RepID=UPI00202410CD